ncbi:hypothetical protein [Litoreibacter arenae]|uniref:Flp pilus assembly protein, pilin Flp n=1 Tax=Litoreibacter arenae DSM 19593 TaxID=1123360 RepID=S9S573_9RHOB|nr:hypothetical protein [Litoreibacter arenae]EPX81334.1 hypothetical protein thalar_00785 [Litoreibacter arenae DSM 19593]
MPPELPAKNLRHMLTDFLRNTSGSAVVDWVVLTAAIAGVGVAVASVVNPGVDNASNDIKRCMKIQGKMWTNDNGDDYARRLARMKRRCGNL